MSPVVEPGDRRVALKICEQRGRLLYDGQRAVQRWLVLFAVIDGEVEEEEVHVVETGPVAL